mmetsp:Transcript_23270/g.35910  ORF Transcript_23270/g.35910 Transcript_23270/m.35910 type:complete len:265 (-) Transcript_23270:770-1564(-)
MGMQQESIEVVEEGEAPSISICESFDSLGTEIEAIGSVRNGKLVIDKIIFNSHDEPELVLERPRSMTTTSTRIDEETKEEIVEEGEEEDPGMLGQMLSTFMDPCLCFHPNEVSKTGKPIKSALKHGSGGATSPSVDRNVSFSSIQVREYNMTLGDHPVSKSGPPVALDWNYEREDVVDLDTYEKARQPRRHRRKLKLSYKDREKILLHDRGFSKDEVREAWVAAIEIRKQRRETIARGALNEKVDEAWESANRKFWRLLSYDTL